MYLVHFVDTPPAPDADWAHPSWLEIAAVDVACSYLKISAHHPITQARLC